MHRCIEHPTHFVDGPCVRALCRAVREALDSDRQHIRGMRELPVSNTEFTVRVRDNTSQVLEPIGPRKLGFDEVEY